MTEGEARRQVARGASRALGERARRRSTTPLLAGRDPDDRPDPEAGPAASPPPDDVPGPADAPAPGPSGDPAPDPTAHPAPDPTADPAPDPPVGAAGGRRSPRPRRLVAVTDDDRAAASELIAAAAEAGGSEPPGGGPTAGEGPGGSGSLEQRLAALLAFLRRRLTGDIAVDDFGFDEELTDVVLLNLLRPLYRTWFRVEVRGIENIPSTGGALIVANHSGTIALDALMTQVAVHDEHPAHRHLRLLGADLVFSTPVLGELARKGGVTLASNADAERLLAGGELVAVWPEGFKGIGKPFSERYKLQRFGRGGFVSAALKTGTPIVPCAIVGAEETYPILGNLPSVARLFGLPYAPVTPTWPWLGLLGLIPLPSKWLIEFCPPVALDDTSGPAAADDPMTVFDLTDLVRQTIQQALYSLLVQRRSIFF